MEYHIWWLSQRIDVAYQTYTTDALVVGSEDRLTADRSVMLFTREAGLVYARAVSVRREQSKLRYGLQDFSLARVSLVRGKQGWRIIGAERAHNLYFATPDRHIRGAVLRVVRLLRRLVRGEEAHVALYDTLVEGLRTLSVCTEETARRGEQVLALRILSMLGYIAPHEIYRPLLAAPSLAMALTTPASAMSEARVVQRALDDALAVSHL